MRLKKGRKEDLPYSRLSMSIEKYEENRTLCVCSQEFKLQNYSDGESAHYIKIRLGESVEDCEWILEFDGKWECV